MFNVMLRHLLQWFTRAIYRVSLTWPPALYGLMTGITFSKWLQVIRDFPVISHVLITSITRNCVGNVSVIEVQDRLGIEIVDLDRKLLCEMSIYAQYYVFFRLCILICNVSRAGDHVVYKASVELGFHCTKMVRTNRMIICPPSQYGWSSVHLSIHLAWILSHARRVGSPDTAT